jgi:hypothetical protein
MATVDPKIREELKAKLEADRAAKTEAENKKAADVYNEFAATYKRERELNPQGTASGYVDRKVDALGDLARKVGKAMGTNKMSSQDDEAQMAARKDVKGYKKGGITKKMASGGKVSQLAKANGIAVRGKSRGTLI